MIPPNDPKQRFLGLGFFISPWPLLAVAVLILNDRFLKHAWPGWVTGKLSDLAGSFFFPLFLLALARLVGLRGRDVQNRSMSQALMGFIVLTDLLFVGIKLSPWFHDRYVQMLSAVLNSPVQVVMDASDLWVLPLANALAWFHFRVWLRWRAP